MPSYSIVIPAYNEQALLPKTLAAVRQAMTEVQMAGEVIVVDNNSTDATAEIARDHGVQVVFEPVNQISRARNAGAQAAKGHLLVFLDADTLLSGALLRAALDNLASGRCCGGGAVVDFDKPMPWLVRGFRSFWNRRAVRSGLAAGCFVYCLREAFDEIGGFSEKVYASEEIWLSRALRLWGKKRGLAFCVITEATAVTSARKLEWFSMWHMAAVLLTMLLFPLALRIRWLCWAWYRRPKNSG